VRSRIASLERIGPEQLDRIDRFFAMMEAFRASLASGGLFYPPFEAARFAALCRTMANFSSACPHDPL